MRANCFSFSGFFNFDLVPSADHNILRDRKMRQANKTKKFSCSRMRAMYICNRKYSSLGKAQKEKLWEGIAFHILKDGVAFTTTEAIGFRTMLRRFLPGFEAPCAKSIVKVCRQLFTRAKEEMKKELAGRKVAITADLATVLNSTRGFLVVSAHALNPDDETKLHKFTLTAKHLPESHSGDNLHKEFLLLLKIFGINLDDVIAGTTDGGLNVVNAMKKLCGQNGHVPCLCHIINALIRRCFKDPKADLTMNIIDKIKRLVTHLKHSNTAMAIYRKLQILAGSLESNLKYLVQSVVTRWNSELLCVERFIEMLSIIKDLVAHTDYSGPEMPTNEEIIVMKEYVQLMKPFETVTTRLSGDSYVTSSSSIPAMEYLLFSLQRNNPSTNAINDFKDLLLVEVQAEISKLLESQVLTLSMFLDPRYKNNFPQDIGKRALIVEKVKSRLREIEGPAVCPPPSKKSRLCTFQDVVSARNSSDAGETSQINQEVRDYLAIPLLTLEENPLEFWESSGDAFPLLKKLASQYLITTASSTASERIVSALNFVLAKRRSRLTSDNVEMLVFLKCLDDRIWERVLMPFQLVRSFPRKKINNVRGNNLNRKK